MSLSDPLAAGFVIPGEKNSLLHCLWIKCRLVAVRQRRNVKEPGLLAVGRREEIVPAAHGGAELAGAVSQSEILLARIDLDIAVWIVIDRFAGLLVDASTCCVIRCRILFLSG
jgi:hypothetical protein